MRALVLGNGLLYVGGDFVVMGGKPRARIAALDPDGVELSELAGG